MGGVYKHGNLWSVNSTVRGSRITRTGFASEQAARAWLADRRAGLTEPQTGPTVAEVIRYYLDHHEHRSVDRSRQLAAHVTRHMGERLAQALRQADADDYAASRRREGAAAKTAWNELALLRTALRYGWRSDVVREAPRFVLSRPACARARTAALDELRLLLAAADLPLRRVIWAAYTWGRRRGEVIGVRWEWLHGDVILVPGRRTKNGRALAFPLSAELRALVEAEPRHPVWMFPAVRRGRNGKAAPVAVPWTKTTLRRRWDALCSACGVVDLHLHDLRRTGASDALAGGHAVAAVQAWGGWADQHALLGSYSHASSQQARAVGEALERRLGVVQGGKR